MNKPFISNNLVYVDKVNWFQVLLYIIASSIKHQSVVYRQLNDQTVLISSNPI